MATTTNVNLDAAPWVHSFSMRQGREWRFPMDLTLNGTAIVLTDATYVLTVSTERGGTSVIAGTETSDWATSGVRVVSAVGGQVTQFIAAGDTGSMVGTYFYEIEVTFPSDHSLLPSAVIPMMEGFITVLDNATS